MTITTPYTFVPFGPTITSGQLWDHDQLTVDPTRHFDRPALGLYTGYLDLTINTLSGLYIGDAASTGTSFRWPGKAGRYAIPGASIRGMLRSHIATLTGAALGLGERDDITPALRNPVAISGDTVQATNSRRAREKYLARRGSAEAHIGRQRVGLLEATADGWHVRETPQFVLPVGGAPRKMFSARWYIVADDLLTHVDGDRRAELAKLRGTPVWVVWGQVEVDGEPRPAAIGLGDTREAAAANAQQRISEQRRLNAIKPDPARSIRWLNFLSHQWERVADPQPRLMVLLPTNLPNLTDSGRPKPEDRTAAANCYLVDHPNNPRHPNGHQPEASLLPVTEEARQELLQILEAKRFDYAPPPPTPEQLKGWPTTENPTCFPVFFDTREGHRGEPDIVTHLGTSNGFAVHAGHTLAQAVRNAGGRWERHLADDPRDNDIVDNLFGAITAEHHIRSRIEVGHATATTDLSALTARYAPLFGAHLDSAATRLDTDGHTLPISYSDDHPTYRGRQYYWHRGDWDGNGATTWQTHVTQHNALWDTQHNPKETTHERESLAPLPVGATFTNRITFTNLSRTELGLLLFTLNHANHDAHNDIEQPTFAHKLGGGKPLGLGSVAITSHLALITANRYLNPTDNGIDYPVDPAPFIHEFLTAAHWNPTNTDPTWVTVNATGRTWPRHVAAWLLVHQWRHRPNPSLTRESTISTFNTKVPSHDIFTIAAKAPAHG